MQKYRTLNCLASSTLNKSLFRLLNMEMTLSQRIQEIIDAGFTQADLYRAATVTKGTSNQWLNGGIKSIKFEYAQGIQTATGFKAEWIVTGKGQKKLGVVKVDTISTASDTKQQVTDPGEKAKEAMLPLSEFIELATLFSKCAPDAKVALMNLARAGANLSENLNSTRSQNKS
jgi:hypothetical protein